jgi:hypothetical protein
VSIIDLLRPMINFAISRKLKHLEIIAKILKFSASISKMVVAAL